MADGDDLELFISQVNAISEPKRGDLLEGCIIALNDHGAVVDLGSKRDGFVPRADLDRLPPEEADLQVGDRVAVMVVEPVDADDNLVVSISQARESGDWLRAQALMESEEIIEAMPQGFNRGGLIVPFGRLRGFVPASHISELPRGLSEAERAEHLERLVGRSMPFKVIEVDPQRRRLILSERKAIRQWRLLQKAKVIRSLKEGEVRKGRVTSLREFGAFVDVGGADGLIHISELSWKHVDNPGDILQVGQEVETLVIRLDRESNRIGLSLKRLQPNPWLEAAERIKPGMILDGVVTRQVNAGVYVCVEDSIEGLVKTNLSLSLPSPGSAVRVRVLGIEPERERMDLEFVEVGLPVGMVEGVEESLPRREVSADADSGPTAQ